MSFKSRTTSAKACELSTNENDFRLGVRGLNRFTKNPDCMAIDSKDLRFQNMRKFILESHEKGLFDTEDGQACYSSATAQKSARKLNHPEEFTSEGKIKRQTKSDLEARCEQLSEQCAKMLAENELLKKQINDILGKVSGQA